MMKRISIFLFTILRVVVGWHFLYEGLVKLFTPDWSAGPYLSGSKWIFAGLFQRLAESPALLNKVDFLNIWGLILIGISFFLGLWVRWSSIAGSILLLFYFLAYPPVPGYTIGTIVEGNYLWVNKIFIEWILLLVFVFISPDFLFGADRWIIRWKREKVRTPVPTVTGENVLTKRREMLRDLIGIPFLGAFAYALYRKRKWDSFEEKFLTEPDGVTGATIKSFNFTALNELKGHPPVGKIGNLELSRLIMGGNLIGGWAHSRDLIYVSKLVKAYHTDERVINTLQLAEQCGINAIITNPQLARILNKYWHETNGKMKFISDCGFKDGFIAGINLSEEAGASAMYCQGEMADRMVLDGKYDVLAKGLELIRSYGKPAGIGAHRIETIKACVGNGIKPDFWVKTLHHHNYWSAHPQSEWKDNMYCFNPEETISFMNNLEEPWIAFKILAAGAIEPAEGFRYAFDHGADFICVGMYDFQIVDDTNLVLDTLKTVNRTRPWRG
ncbi:MAG: DoxX family protein [Bacteroidales bacterium]|nr:DoxX family protein [Bacteroidales bacterium]